MPMLSENKEKMMTRDDLNARAARLYADDTSKYVISVNNEFCLVVDTVKDAGACSAAEVYDVIGKDTDIVMEKFRFLSDKIFVKENNIKRYIKDKIEEGKQSGKNFVTLNDDFIQFLKMGYQINKRIYKTSNYAENCTRKGNKLFFELT